MSNNRVYLADKPTLDDISTKIGSSPDNSSSSPTTLFSGIKHLISNISTLNTIRSNIGTSSDASSSTPSTLFSGVKNVISLIQSTITPSIANTYNTVTNLNTTVNTVNNKLDTVSAATVLLDNSIRKVNNSIHPTKIRSGNTTIDISNSYTNILSSNTPGNLYYVLFTFTTGNLTNFSIRITIDGNIIYNLTMNGAYIDNNAVGFFSVNSLPNYISSNNSYAISIPSVGIKLFNISSYPHSISSTANTSVSNLYLPLPLRFNSNLLVESRSETTILRATYLTVLD